MVELPEKYLQKCTVRLRISGEQGTGFFVSPGLILTCSHVVAFAGSSPIHVFWKAENQNYTAKVEKILEDSKLDLALLKLETEVPNHPCVYFDQTVPQTDDPLFIFGYPKDCYEDYSDGDSATFKYEGESFKGTVLWHKLKAGQIKEGFSGSPLLNLRTGGVCGIVNISRSTTSDLGGRAVSTTVILSHFPQLVVQKQNRQRTGINPFEFGNPVQPKHFYGRQRAIADLKNRIGAISAQCINIVGQRRNGKSSLLRYIKECTEVFCVPQQKPLIVTLDLQNRRLHTPEGIIKELRRSIIKYTQIEPWSLEANQEPYEYEIEDGLIDLRDRGYRLIVMFDEFECIGQHLEQFQDWGGDWRAKAGNQLFALVIASKRPLSEIYNIMKLESPFGNIFNQTILGALEEDAWHNLVLDGFKEGGDLDSPDPLYQGGNKSREREFIPTLSRGVEGGLDYTSLQWIDDLAGGLPYYTQMAAALLWQHGELEQAEAEFIFQATPRFQELWEDLTVQERHALRHAAGTSGLATPSLAISKNLQRHGLLRLDNRLFSSAFAEFVREQR